ncbi:MAG: hypothetical protein U1B78_04735, partial [Dehalococcoidia bacterium]|nr:hypothetical protein [Dehalococcoidia bacterium]
AHDLGEALGCHAHLEELTRTRSGPFTLDEALTPDALREAAAQGGWQELLYSVDRVLESWSAAILGDAHTRDVCSGRLVVLAPEQLDLPEPAPESPCRAYSDTGEFLAVLRYRGAKRWHPERVFAKD